MVIIIPPVTVAKLVGLQRKAKEFKSSEWGVAWKGHQVDAELIGDQEITAFNNTGFNSQPRHSVA